MSAPKAENGFIRRRIVSSPGQRRNNWVVKVSNLNGVGFRRFGPIRPREGLGKAEPLSGFAVEPPKAVLRPPDLSTNGEFIDVRDKPEGRIRARDDRYETIRRIRPCAA